MHAGLFASARVSPKVAGLVSPKGWGWTMSGRSTRFIKGRIGHAACVVVSLAVTTLILLRLHFTYGYPIGDSTQFNVPWSVAFSQQFWSGDLYPRWLFSYPPNLGSPVFYFYGPLPFYLIALIKGIAPGLTPTEALTALHALLYWLSGLAFYGMLRRYVSDKISLLAACFYAGAAYHVLDLEYRNAIGEAMAYIFVPLVFACLLDTLVERRTWCLALPAYGCLIASHLPSALLATPFIVLAAVVAYRDHPMRGLARLSVIGVGGALLAGPYLLPALALRDWLRADAWLGDPTKWPESWLLPAGFFFRSGGLLYGAILATSGLALLVWAGVTWRFPLSRSRSAEGPLARTALIGLAIVLMLISQPTQWFWTHVGPLRDVQFPFRLGVVSDVLSVSLVALALERLVSRLQVQIGWTWFVATAALLLIMTSMLASQTDLGRVYANRDATIDERPLTCCTLPSEYWLPAVLDSEAYIEGGTPEAYQSAATGFAPLLPARRLEPDETLDMSIRVDGLLVDAHLRSPTDVRLAQAYLAAWRMTADDVGRPVALRADPQTGLVVASLPAGRHRFRLSIPETPPERWGKLAGAAGLLTLAAAWGVPRRRILRARDAARAES